MKGIGNIYKTAKILVTAANNIANKAGIGLAPFLFLLISMGYRENNHEK